MSCCIPDVDIQVVYNKTGKPGMISLESLIQDISCIVDGSNDECLQDNDELPIVFPGIGTTISTLNEQTFRILVTAHASYNSTTNNTTYTYTANSVEGGTGVVSTPTSTSIEYPIISSSATPSMGELVFNGATSTFNIVESPLLVTIVFPVSFTTGYNTQLTPIRFKSSITTNNSASGTAYAHPLLSIYEADSNNIQLTFSVDEVVQMGFVTTPGVVSPGLQAVITKLSFSYPNVSIDNLLSYQFGVEVTVEGV